MTRKRGCRRVFLSLLIALSFRYFNSLDSGLHHLPMSVRIAGSAKRIL
jgi:hypothetical protein